MQQHYFVVRISMRNCLPRMRALAAPSLNAPSLPLLPLSLHRLAARAQRSQVATPLVFGSQQGDGAAARSSLQAIRSLVAWHGVPGGGAGGELVPCTRGGSRACLH